MPSSNIPENFLVDEGLPAGTVSAVADVLDLLTYVEANKLNKNACVGLFLVHETCAQVLRYAESEMEKTLLVPLSDKEFFTLAEVAESHGISVRDVAHRSIESYIAGMRAALNPENPVAR